MMTRLGRSTIALVLGAGILLGIIGQSDAQAVPPTKPAAAPTGPPATPLSDFERKRGRMILGVVRADLEKYYYDETFHGVDLGAAFDQAGKDIDGARSTTDIFMAIARPLFLLDDSHTIFLPPARAAHIRYGWEGQIIGERCFVTAVEEGTDAEAKGLKRGDEILDIDGDRPTRATFPVLMYVHRALAPQVRTSLAIAHPDGTRATLRVDARVVPIKMITDLRESTQLNDFIREARDEEYLARHRFIEVGDTLYVWKMPGFDLPPNDVKTKVLRQVKKYRNLIIDLRGNGGGSVETLQTLVGGLAGERTKIADPKARKPQLPVMARKAGDVYDGTIVVLVDSLSASASELLARTLQIEGRAKVVGDRTAGMVMESEIFDHMIGDRSGIFFATNITIADLIMTDGHSLEHNGVVPDEIVLPTAEDIASGRDPAMARAAALCGVPMTPEVAGAMFPVEWHR
jgi:C-terminal processing protease CtpA/Prc